MLNQDWYEQKYKNTITSNSSNIRYLGIAWFMLHNYNIEQVMKVNTKFDLDDTVYFLGDHQVFEAKVIEVRCLKRYKEPYNKNDKDVELELQELEVYRLATKKHWSSEFSNTTLKVYTGEFTDYQWFPPSILYKTPEEAIGSIQIEYLKKKNE